MLSDPICIIEVSLRFGKYFVLEIFMLYYTPTKYYHFVAVGLAGEYWHLY